MNYSKKEFPAQALAIDSIVQYAVDCMKAMKINEKLLLEYRLPIEETALKLISAARETDMITVEAIKHISSVQIMMKCPGTPVVLTMEDPDDYSGKILEEYRNHFKQSYSSGINSVSFHSAASLNYKGILIAFAASILTVLLMHAFLNTEQIDYMSSSILPAILAFFAGLMETIATPVVFFAIASMIVKLKWQFEHDNQLFFLFARYIVNSLIALLLTFLTLRVVSSLFAFTDLSGYTTANQQIIGSNLEEIIENITTSNIVDIFYRINPIPMLILAVLAGIAAGSIFGKEGQHVRGTLQSLSSLFNRILALVYRTIPVFLYFALIDGWLDDGPSYFLYMIRLLLLFAPPIVIILLVYSVELASAKINPFTFFKEYRSILWENFKIGSNADAVPYNTRMLHRKTGASLQKLKEGLSLGAMVNMDGNCLILAGGIFYIVSACHVNLGAAGIIGMAMIVILISIGAPNQPGSFIIGMTFIYSYVGISYQLFDILIIIEVLMGAVYPFINTLGDIVTMAIVAKVKSR